MSDRREKIIEAGLMTLRQYGYAGFTQNRVAALAGLRQSHLTYYHPTRLALLTAVAEAAVTLQLAAVDATLGSLTSLDEVAEAIAKLVDQHQNTRVLMALAQAGDEEPRLRELFCQLADGIVDRICTFFDRAGYPGLEPERARSLHALSVGLAVVGLATDRTDGKQRAADILKFVMPLLAAAPDPHVGKQKAAAVSKRGHNG